MYTKFYGLKEKPFKLVPDPRFLYMSEVHRAAISHLQYGLEDRNGFVVITGELGSGKTLLLRVLLNGLPRTSLVARIINTNFNAKELIEHILNEFGIETRDETKPKMISMLTQLLLKAYSERREVLLVIDEAQNLSIDAMEELRMISNLETSTEKLVQIVMVGQPQLKYKLNLPDLEQLRQRVTVQFHMTPLSEEETSLYVNHRLSVAIGRPSEIFTPEALKKIYAYSKGIPRLINVISDAGLRLGYVEEKKIVDGEIMDGVIQELQEIGSPSAAQVLPRKSTETDPLDLYVIELNKKFQTLYDQMQKVYIQKGEENQLIYERLLNMEEEMQAKGNLFNLQDREQMLFRKESEIHQKLSEVSKRLDEINTLKESIEEKRNEVLEKIQQAELRPAPSGEQEDPASGRPEAAGGGVEDKEIFKKRIEEPGEVQARLEEREEELDGKMEDLKGIIQELENKKVLLEAIGQDKSIEDRLKELEKQQQSVRRKEEELTEKILLLEKGTPRPAAGAVRISGPGDQASFDLKEELFLDLISQIDSLKSDMDSLDFQKQIMETIRAEEADLPTGMERIDKNYVQLKKKEEKLLKNIEASKKSFRAFEVQAAAEDSGTGAWLGKERLLEKKLDELRNMILRIGGKDAPLTRGDRGPVFFHAMVRASSGQESEDSHRENKALGRRFNRIIRKILQGS